MGSTLENIDAVLKSIITVEYKTDKSSRVEGWLFGTGEKLGAWDALGCDRLSSPLVSRD